MNTFFYQAILNNETGRLLLGVDGLSRSGKTTLVNELSSLLSSEGKRVVTIHLDDYITARDARYHTNLPEWVEYYRLQWDVAELKEKLFMPLREATRIELPRYDEAKKEYVSHEIDLETADVVIVEGVFLQRPEWKGFFDQVLYLDVSRKQRFLREQEQTKQNVDKFKRRYWKAEEFYLETCHPRREADFVFDLPTNRKT